MLNAAEIEIYYTQGYVIPKSLRLGSHRRGHYDHYRDDGPEAPLAMVMSHLSYP